MDGSAIFAPFFGMLLLTLVVWIVMYVRRLRFIFGHRIAAQSLTTPDKGAKVIPEEINWSAYNLRNLFEIPVLFYALCLYLFATGRVDQLYVTCAWLFVAFRIVHSAIHCTVNIVHARFLSYMVASVILWYMIIRAGFQYFA